ncbi:M20/M25/M40 family metallo-hydrolase [Pedobacter petrophilus]|nr:M20/M25/M40 family metallo-hydrolase [Pedobacter petrophilus]
MVSLGFALLIFNPALAQVDADSVMIRKIYTQVLKDHTMDQNLRELVYKIGPRISGSAAAEQTVVWAKSVMEGYKPDRVYLQPVTVPRWERGDTERAYFSASGGKSRLDISALGGSIPTDGILQSEVVEVNSWKALADMTDAEIAGKFVFFNRAMDPTEVEVFKAYLKAVDQRSLGAIAAAKRGAVGALIRSLTLSKDNVPHTGAVSYDEKVKKIPAVALSTISADRLSAALKADPRMILSLELKCRLLSPVRSNNVIAEIKGWEFPQEIVTLGAHLDSWDLGQGASDDGTGLVQSMEMLRVFNQLGFRPARTVRVVLYMNEEAGAHGAVEYARQATLNGEKHIAVMESDAGGFAARGFRVEAGSKALKQFRQWAKLFETYKAGDIQLEQRGIDLVPMKNKALALISLDCDDSRLFDIHHSRLDTYDKINPREVAMGAAAMSAMVLLISKYGLQ